MHHALNIDLLDRLIRLRAVVARAGENDQFGWWADEILNPSVGLVVAERLFPRTYRWAALELAMAAAAYTERNQLNRRSAITLFSMPESVERAVDLRFRELKIDVPDAEDELPKGLLTDDPPSLVEQVSDIVGDGPQNQEGWTNEESLLHLGNINEVALLQGEKFEGTLSTLAWAYTRSEEGALKVPYYTLNGGSSA